MQTKLIAYLSFRGNTREVMEFYKSVFGGNLQLMTFKEFNAAQDASEENQIMHSELTGESGIILQASDAPMRVDMHPGTNFSLSLNGDNEGELSGYFNQLAVGGTVTQPLTKAGWGDIFGMVTDRFEVTWLVNISAAQA
jgi:PhnB protein